MPLKAMGSEWETVCSRQHKTMVEDAPASTGYVVWTECIIEYQPARVNTESLLIKEWDCIHRKNYFIGYGSQP